jgi:hypothetical protein
LLLPRFKHPQLEVGEPTSEQVVTAPASVKQPDSEQIGGTAGAAPCSIQASPRHRCCCCSHSWRCCTAGAKPTPGSALLLRTLTPVLRFAGGERGSQRKANSVAMSSGRRPLRTPVWSKSFLAVSSDPAVRLSAIKIEGSGRCVCVSGDAVQSSKAPAIYRRRPWFTTQMPRSTEAACPASVMHDLVGRVVVRQRPYHPVNSFMTLKGGTGLTHM